MKIEDIKVGMKVIMCVPKGEECYLGRCGVHTGEVGIVQRIFPRNKEVGVIFPNADNTYRTDIWYGKDYEFTVDPDWWDIWTN